MIKVKIHFRSYKRPNIQELAMEDIQIQVTELLRELLHRHGMVLTPEQHAVHQLGMIARAINIEWRIIYHTLPRTEPAFLRVEYNRPNVFTLFILMNDNEECVEVTRSSLY